MLETRRQFVISLAAASGLATPNDLFQLGGAQPGLPKAPKGENREDQEGDRTDPKIARRILLAQNARDFRQGVAQLSVMIQELKEEVDKAPALDILSVRMYKKTEEIERLAKKLKGKLKR